MQKKTLSIVVLLLSIIWCSSSIADIRPRLKNRVGIPPFQVLKEIIKTNYTNKTAIGHYGSEKTPPLTWLVDADPRIFSGLVTSSKNIYEVHNLGNQLSSSIATVDYGIRHLHTPVLLITGNSDSEAIRLFNEGYGDLEQTIRLELDHLHIPLSNETAVIVEKETKQDKKMRLIEANVDYQVALASKRYSQRIKAGRLVVVGSVLDLNNHYGLGKNKLRIINVNGEKDGAKLKKNRLFRPLAPDMLEMVGRKKKSH